MALRPDRIVEAYLKDARLLVEEEPQGRKPIRPPQPVGVLEHGDAVSRASNPVVPQRAQPATPDVIKPVARPKIKPPRAKPEASKTWGTDTKRENMREYMSDYRGTGRINERKPQ